MTADGGTGSVARAPLALASGGERGPGLIEREQELSVFDAAIAGALRGQGSVVRVYGAAGIGKTSLLTAGQEAARDAGMRVASAVATESEREFPFGAARQLFEPLLSSVDGAARRRWLRGAGPAAQLLRGGGSRVKPATAELFGELVGLFSLATNLAAERPLLISVDDAQWLDEASRRWLAFVIRRVHEVRIVLAIAERRDPGRGPDSFPQARDGAVIVPSPLSDAAVAHQIGELFGTRPAPAFVQACARATGGNPLLLAELLRVMVRSGTEPTDENASRVPHVAPEELARACEERLTRVSTIARSVAQAAAILEPRAAVATVQEMTGLSADQVAAGADELLDAELLSAARPLSFEHPILGEAVRQSLRPGERGRLHAAAARAIESGGGAPELVGAHLLASDPAQDAWAVRALVTAAEAAARAGAHASAVRLLQRAAIEPPSSSRRGEIALALGRAQFAAQDPGCIAQLRDALPMATWTRGRGEIASLLCEALLFGGDPAGTMSVARAVVAELGTRDPELRDRMLALELAAASNAGDTRAADELIQRLGADAGDWSDGVNSPARRELASEVAFRMLTRGDDSTAVAALAQRALPPADPVPAPELPGRPLMLSLAPICLLVSERYQPAERFLQAGISEGKLGYLAAAWATTTLAQLHIQRGRLAAAETAARSALSLGGELEFPVVSAMAQATLVDALVELDRAVEARTHDHPVPEALTGLPISLYVHESSGRLALAQRRWTAAAAAFTAARSAASEGGVICPAMTRSRSGLALALAGLGRQSEAVALADEELVLARRFGAPGVLGRSLRTVALVGPPAGRRPGLAAALEAFDRSEMAVEREHTRVLLGAEMRRRGERGEARGLLVQGLESAVDLGAVAVERVAREELRTLGLRARAARRTGRSALTASELRAARLASEGLTNRQIAQVLFVTVKTVEKHLGTTYLKLGLSGRDELAAALHGDSRATVATAPSASP